MCVDWKTVKRARVVCQGLLGQGESGMVIGIG